MLTASILSNNRVKQKPNSFGLNTEAHVFHSVVAEWHHVAEGPAPVQPQLMLLFMLVIHPPFCTDPYLFHGKEKGRRSTREYFMRLQSAHQANDLKVMEAQNVNFFCH